MCRRTLAEAIREGKLKGPGGQADLVSGREGWRNLKCVCWWWCRL